MYMNTKAQNKGLLSTMLRLIMLKAEPSITIDHKYFVLKYFVLENFVVHIFNFVADNSCRIRLYRRMNTLFVFLIFVASANDENYLTMKISRSTIYTI